MSKVDPGALLAFHRLKTFRQRLCRVSENQIREEFPDLFRKEGTLTEEEIEKAVETLIEIRLLFASY